MSLKRKIKNLVIKKVKIIDKNLRYKVDKDEIIKLNGSKIKNILRRSKFLIFELNKGYDLVTINRKMEQSKLISKNLNLYQITRYIIGSLIAIINVKVFKLKIKDKGEFDSLMSKDEYDKFCKETPN